jgi:ABC-type multidrug transport system fused ATPase/permease subunit
MQKDATAVGVSKSISVLSRVSRQGRNYATLVSWLLYRVFRGRLKKLAIAIALNLVQLASQAAAIYVVYWYAKQMEQGGIVSIPFLNMEVNLRGQFEWLWIVVICSTICFITSAYLVFLSRRLVLNISEEHYAQSLERLVLQTQCVPDPRAPIASRLLVDHGLGGLSAGCRRGALIAGTFANAISAIVGGLGAAVLLVKIDPLLTVLILVAAALAALFLYPLAIRAVDSAKAREKATDAFRDETRNLYQLRTRGQRVASLQTASELARAYIMRRRVVTEIIFATEIGVTVILSVVIYYMASRTLGGAAQWAIFIAYIGALRITLVGCSQGVRAFAGISRYYPGIVRHYLFTKDFEKIDAAPLAKVQHGDTIIMGSLPSGQDVVAKAGERIALMTCDAVPMVLFALIDARITESAQPVGASVVDPSGPTPGEGGLALIYADQLESGEAEQRTLADLLNDKVALLTYIRPDKVGRFGETKLLTVSDAELRRFVELGTKESEAALKEVLYLRAKKRGTLFEDDDEEEEA